MHFGPNCLDCGPCADLLERLLLADEGKKQADSPDEWQELATDNLKAAQTLLATGHWQQAFYSAGFAVECALKCRIMRREGLNRWPERGERREVYSHRLTALAEVAGLQPFLLAEVYNDLTVLGLSWMVAKDWDNEIRYAPGAFPQVRARQMVEAVNDGGLLEWLLTPPS